MLEILNAWLKRLGEFALGRVLPVLVVGIIGMVIIRIIMRVLKTALQKTKTEKAVNTLLCSVVRIILYVLLGLILASGLGIDVTGVVAFASVLTLAISLSLQTAISNVIGGFTLLYTKPFVSGDFVEIAGQSGIVQEVGLTYTKLATGDNKVVSIPNSAVTAAEIVNYTVAGTRRVDVKLSVSYTVQAETVLQALRQAAQGLPLLEDEEPFAAVHSYTDNGVVYVLQVWCKCDDYWSTLFAANQNVKKLFDEKQIPMTCYNVNVHMEK